MQAVAPFLFAFLVGFLFAWATGTIAARKGRNAVAWAMVGLFLGVIGVLIAYLVPRKEPAFD